LIIAAIKERITYWNMFVLMSMVRVCFAISLFIIFAFETALLPLPVLACGLGLVDKENQFD